VFPREYFVYLFPKRGKDRHKFYIGNEKWGKCFLYTLCVMTLRDDRGADDGEADDTEGDDPAG
jgi:hypothetical protein